jgi:hypothetical protein
VNPLANRTRHLDLGEFTSSDPYYQIFRRFGFLHTLALLDLQHDLNELDRRFKDNPQDMYEKKLMEETRDKLKAYGDLIDQQRRFLGLNPPTAESFTDVLQWVSEANGLDTQKNDFDWLRSSNNSWLSQRDDFVSLAPDGGTTKLETFLFNLVIMWSPYWFVKVPQDMDSQGRLD